MTDLKTIEVTMHIDAAPAAVFQAVTNTADVQAWFAECADISLPEKRYDFWGRFTPEAPDREQGRHPLLRVEGDRFVAFAWPVRNGSTQVEFSLKAAQNGTELTLRHQGVPAVHQPYDYVLSDFWSFALENLRGWVESRTVGIRCDFSAIQQGHMRLSVDIAADREAIFQTLIRPEQLQRYIAVEATVEPQVGGQYSYGWGAGGPVNILELVPDEKLALTWTYPQEPKTVLTWTLADSGGKTNLTLVHSGFASDRSMADYQVGWSNFLNRIKFLVEAGERWQRPQFLSSDWSG